MADDTRVRAITVAGSSMAPSLPEGSQVAVASMRLEELRPGDIVLFETPSGRTIHRLITSASIGGRHVVFHRGDNGGGIGMADAGAVMGKAVAILSTLNGASGQDAASITSTRRIWTAALRCRLYCWSARIAQMFGPLHGPVFEKIRALARKKILGY